VPEALRRLEARLAADPNGRFAHTPPRVVACIGWRELPAGAMFPRRWIVETDAAKSDFAIATERSACVDGIDAALIDTVARFGVPFAWIYAVQHGKTR